MIKFEVKYWQRRRLKSLHSLSSSCSTSLSSSQQHQLVPSFHVHIEVKSLSEPDCTLSVKSSTEWGLRWSELVQITGDTCCKESY